MPANRLTRDQILIEALQLADVPSVNVIDFSNGNPYTGTINSGALSIKWLQRYIDYFHGVFPWSSVLISTSGTLTVGSNTFNLPADFVLDFKDGVSVTVDGKQRKVFRRGPQHFIPLTANSTPAAPRIYTVNQARILLHPTPDLAYPITIWYYQLPAILGASDVPKFPSDLVLVEAVRIRALEWTRQLPPGAALEYCTNITNELRKAGLAYEPESSDIPFDPFTFIPGAGSPENGAWSWMGELGT